MRNSPLVIILSENLAEMAEKKISENRSTESIGLLVNYYSFRDKEIMDNSSNMPIMTREEAINRRCEVSYQEVREAFGVNGICNCGVFVIWHKQAGEKRLNCRYYRSIP